jgi:1,4-alpha-glucan branching enzyme
MVSWPTRLGGLGFSLKWNMGWMNDILKYFQNDPIYRSYQHNLITFGMMYAYSENFVLPFSHDEVVYGKKSMLEKMPGDPSQKFANLRLLYGFFLGHPGKKLLFMGSDFGQWNEWNHDASLDWHLLQFNQSQGLQQWVRDLLMFYKQTPALYELDNDPKGFEWIDCNDHSRSVVSFLRRGKKEDVAVAFVCNFTPVARENYRIGVPWEGKWEEILNSDAFVYGGGGGGNMGCVSASPVAFHSRPYSLNLMLPPLSVIVLKSSQPEFYKNELPEEISDLSDADSVSSS